MRSLMLASGIVSRLVWGWICDHIGGVRTLLLGSALQGVALLMFLPTAGLVPLYGVSALFGLFQDGDVTGNYRAAFLNGIGWNLLHLSIAGRLYWRTRGNRAPSTRAHRAAPCATTGR